MNNSEDFVNALSEVFDAICDIIVASVEAVSEVLDSISKSIAAILEEVDWNKVQKAIQEAVEATRNKKKAHKWPRTTRSSFFPKYTINQRYKIYKICPARYG